MLDFAQFDGTAVAVGKIEILIGTLSPRQDARLCLSRYLSVLLQQDRYDLVEQPFKVAVRREIYCRRCGQKSTQKPHDVIQHHRGCSVCAGNSRVESERKYRQQLHVQNRIDTDSSPYSCHTKRQVRCNNCGQTRECLPKTVSVGCAVCNGTDTQFFINEYRRLLEVQNRIDVDPSTYNRLRARAIYCKNCQTVSRQKPGNILSRGDGCGICNPKSRAEMEIYAFVKGLVENAIHGDRQAINPLELDVFVPDKKVAIEYCGLFWHGEKFLGHKKAYRQHRDKLLVCRDRGIRLLTVFEDEWLTRKRQVCGYIQAVLGRQDVIVGARDCTVQAVEPVLVSKFIADNHIQGYGRGQVAYALIHAGEVVSAAVFRQGSGRGRAQPGIWELTRYCVRIGYKIHGGLGKILAEFRRHNQCQELLTFSDLRWSEGALYNSLGFVQKKINQPSYWYFRNRDGSRRYHKCGFQKSRLIRRYGGNIQATEWELAKAAGFDRIWDCGTETWSLIWV